MVGGRRAGSVVVRAIRIHRATMTGLVEGAVARSPLMKDQRRPDARADPLPPIGSEVSGVEARAQMVGVASYISGGRSSAMCPAVEAGHGQQ